MYVFDIAFNLNALVHVFVLNQSWSVLLIIIIYIFRRSCKSKMGRSPKTFHDGHFW